jgi:hypothetical protein
MEYNTPITVPLGQLLSNAPTQQPAIGCFTQSKF